LGLFDHFDQGESRFIDLERSTACFVEEQVIIA